MSERKKKYELAFNFAKRTAVLLPKALSLNYDLASVSGANFVRAKGREHTRGVFPLARSSGVQLPSP